LTPTVRPAAAAAPALLYLGTDMPVHKGSKASGFTLIEVLIVLLVAAILLTLGVPLLNNMIQRAQLEGFARQMAILVQQARFNAIKKSNTQSVVRIDVAKKQVLGFADVDNDGVYDTTKGDYQLGLESLPNGVEFDFPTADPNPGITTGLSTDPSAGGSSSAPKMAIFASDGSIQVPGAFRVADHHGNYMEVQVSPQGTARVQVLKWDGTGWREQGYNGKPWVWN
jgi:prepilin-type N-terminal cleavage/methylation domain-containing protein